MFVFSFSLSLSCIRQLMSSYFLTPLPFFFTFVSAASNFICYKNDDSILKEFTFEQSINLFYFFRWDIFFQCFFIWWFEFDPKIDRYYFFLSIQSKQVHILNTYFKKFEIWIKAIVIFNYIIIQQKTMHVELECLIWIKCGETKTNKNVTNEVFKNQDI